VILEYMNQMLFLALISVKIISLLKKRKIKKEKR
jgi:hypothetical protein